MTEVAEEFNTTVATVRGLIRAHNIPTTRLPYSGGGKGLDRAARRIIAKSLGKPIRRASRANA
jgi:hypothetical protein